MDAGRLQKFPPFKLAIGRGIEPNVLINPAALDREIAFLEVSENSAPEHDLPAQTNLSAGDFKILLVNPNFASEPIGQPINETVHGQIAAGRFKPDDKGRSAVDYFLTEQLQRIFGYQLRRDVFFPIVIVPAGFGIGYLLASFQSSLLLLPKLRAGQFAAIELKLAQVA